MTHRQVRCGVTVATSTTLITLAALAVLLVGLVASASADGEAEANLQAHLTAMGIAPQASDGLPGEGAVKGFESPLVIPAGELRSDGSEPEGYYFTFVNGGPRGYDAACMVAPVYLSAGNTISGYSVSVYDRATDVNVGVSLRRVNVVTGSAELLSTVVSSGTNTAPALLSRIGLAYAVDRYHAYYLTTCLSSQQVGIIGIKIWYTKTPSEPAEQSPIDPGSAPQPKGFPDGDSGMLEWLIPAAAFSADGQAARDNHRFDLGSGFVSGDDDAFTGGCLMAPVYPPNDAEIHGFEASLFDNNSVQKAFAALWRVDSYNGGDAQCMSYVETTTNSSSIQVVLDDTVEHPDIETPRYSYYVTTCLEFSDLKLYAVRLYYTNGRLFKDGLETGTTGQWSSTEP